MNIKDINTQYVKGVKDSDFKRLTTTKGGSVENVLGDVNISMKKASHIKLNMRK